MVFISYITIRDGEKDREREKKEEGHSFLVPPMQFKSKQDIIFHETLVMPERR